MINNIEITKPPHTLAHLQIASLLITGMFIVQTNNVFSSMRLNVQFM